MKLAVPLKLKGIGKKSVLVSLASVLMGSIATVAAFAAIPNSTTGIISGCVGRFTGIVRAVDTQSGASCTLLESSVSWPSASASTNESKNALLYLTQSSTDNLQLALDTSKSHNVVSVKIVNDPNPDSSNQYLCAQANFSPLAATMTNLVGTAAGVGGIGSPTTSTLSNPQLSSTGTDIAALITTNCGSGYNVMFNYIGGNSPARPVAYMLFN